MAQNEEQLVFGPTMEGLFVRALKERLTPALIQELREAGLDVERPLLPAYTRAVVNATIGIVARALYPSVPIDEAWYQIGKQYLFGTKKTALGSATLALLRVMGPKRALNRLARTFRTTNNYMEVDLRPATDGGFELDLRPSNDQPRYMQAIIEDVLLHAGAKNLKVEVAKHDAVEALATYRITFA